MRRLFGRTGYGGPERTGRSEGFGGGVGTLELIIGVLAVLIVVIFLLGQLGAEL